MTILKKQIIVFAIITILLVMPFAGSSAFGVSITASANLESVCGFDPISPVNMGTLTPGSITDEITVTITPSVNTSGSASVSVTAGDWLGAASNAIGTITLTGVTDANTVTINNLVYTAVTVANSDPVKFKIDGSDTITATNLKDSINKRTNSNVTAISQSNVVTVTAVNGGIDGNNITMAKTGVTIVLSGPQLTGGVDADGIVHMESEVTKFSITSDGNSPASVGSNNIEKYDAKTSVGANGTNTAMIGNTDPENDIQIALQISGDRTLKNLPYSGALTQTLTFTFSCSS